MGMIEEYFARHAQEMERELLDRYARAWSPEAATEDERRALRDIVPTVGTFEGGPDRRDKTVCQKPKTKLRKKVNHDANRERKRNT